MNCLADAKPQIFADLRGRSKRRLHLCFEAGGHSLSGGSGSAVCDLHELLADVLAFQHADEGARRVLDAFGDGLTVL
jgi:hypothetical protein